MDEYVLLFCIAPSGDTLVKYATENVEEEHISS